jgi:hypothetical protein
VLLCGRRPIPRPQLCVTRHPPPPEHTKNRTSRIMHGAVNCHRRVEVPDPEDTRDPNRVLEVDACRVLHDSRAPLSADRPTSCSFPILVRPRVLLWMPDKMYLWRWGCKCRL